MVRYRNNEHRRELRPCLFLSIRKAPSPDRPAGLAVRLGVPTSRVHDALKNPFTRDNQPTAVFGEGGADRLSITTRRPISPFRNASRNVG